MLENETFIKTITISGEHLKVKSHIDSLGFKENPVCKMGSS